ncbi:L,D-transpeptidase-like protein [Litoreibacter meonggei]|uniref:L,D-transpeptidase-like protein n=1 Tax=Litoreibacter meonggei TaxID=1049199 RepID=A0A497WRZ6_9RHOB|nr:L,D-transpeptidase family protein [Litoreibacter meonggei]RLJ52024.1 L,D-transpeptidase-like protein [Litoreibacter meonggei]
MRFVLLRGLLLASLLILSACSSKFATYNGPEVTKLEIHKTQRILRVFHGNRLLKTYEVDLGFGARGHKQVEGDGRTPEGRYTIDRRNPNSSFYLSLGISYPNARDRAYARSIGKSPGGDIFIHGQPNLKGKRGPDWTAGCIAIRNKEMRLLYAMVKNGTVIDIFP